jgi:cysteine desulfurase / selenocysteine lyase
VLAFVIPGVPNESIARHLDKTASPSAPDIIARNRPSGISGLESSVRPSLAFYNTREEVDALVLALALVETELNREA